MKNLFHLRDALSASQRDLTQWLNKLPDISASQWRGTPFPLFRALQLEDMELFHKWLKWGCNLNSPTPFRNPLARRSEFEERTITALFKKSSDVLSYIAKFDPGAFEMCVKILMQEHPNGLNNVNLVKLIHQSGANSELLSDMAMGALVYGGYELGPLLHAQKGQLTPRERWVSNYTTVSEWAWVDGAEGVTQDEYKICARINQLESGALQRADVSALVDMGMIVAAHDLKQHLIFNEAADNLTVDRKNFSWHRLAKTLTWTLPNGRGYRETHTFNFTVVQWNELFNSVFEDILDVRAIDKNKQTVFHFLYMCNALPVEVQTHIARKAWEIKPNLLTMVDRKFKKSFLELTGNTNNALRQIIDGWQTTARITNMLEHQTTKETQHKISENHDEPVRRRRM